MKVKIYKRVERFGSLKPLVKWFTTEEAAYNFGHDDALGPAVPVTVTLSAAGLVRFLNREM